MLQSPLEQILQSRKFISTEEITNFKCLALTDESIIQAKERMANCLLSFSFVCQNKQWEVLNGAQFENGLDQERQRVLYECIMDSIQKEGTNPESADKYLEMCTTLIADEKMLVNILKHNYQSPFTAEYLSQNMRTQDALFFEKFRILVASPVVLDRKTVQHLKEQVLVKLRNEPKMASSDIDLYLSFFFKNSIQGELDLETLNLLENSSSSVLVKEILINLILQNLQSPKMVCHAYKAVILCDTAVLYKILQPIYMDSILAAISKILKEIKQETSEEFQIIVHCISIIKHILSKAKYWISIGQKETLQPLYNHTISWIQAHDLSDLLVKFQLCKSVKVFNAVQELIKDHLPVEEDQKMTVQETVPTGADQKMTLQETVPTAADDWGSHSQEMKEATTENPKVPKFMTLEQAGAMVERMFSQGSNSQGSFVSGKLTQSQSQ